MKKIFILIGFVLFALMPMMAQYGNDKERMEYVRERYATAQASAAQSKDPEVPNNYTTITRMENKAAVGQCKEVVELFYDEVHENEWEPYPSSYKLTLVRRSYNVAARQFYEEFLYDVDGEPLFWFARYDGFFSDGTSGKVELRYYYRQGKQSFSIYKIADEEGNMNLTPYRDEFDEVCSGVEERFEEFHELFDVYYNKYNENAKD